MPIVPQFQGGTPQVRSNGGAGATPIRSQIQPYDYGRVLQEAMRPVENFSTSLTEALRINHARTVKAESDDAERQVMNVINTAMLDPEKGFTRLQGKNAMDAYGTTVEGMKSDVDKIVGGLQPQVREAVASRLQDRLTHAVQQAGGWYAQQTRSYHLDSSKFRIEALQKDASGHYADSAYLNATWGSIAQEVDYISGILGSPPEAVKQMKDQQYSLLQAQRYGAWAQDDPVSAFAHFRENSAGIDPDVKSKIESGLFTKSRDLLAMTLAGAPVSFDDKGNAGNLAWMDDPLAKTGNGLIDSLPKAQRLDVILKARQLRSTMLTETRDGFATDVANNLSEAAMGENPQPLALSQFVEVYGGKEGQKRFDQYQLDFRGNRAKWDFRTMADADIDATLAAMKPKSGAENYAAEAKGYSALVSAAEKVRKDRRDDKIGYLIANEAAGYQPLNFADSNALRSQLSFRARNVAKVQSNWGGTPQVLSKDESTALVKALDAATVNERVEILGTVADGLGPQGLAALTGQLKDADSYYSVAASAMLEFPDGGTTSVGAMCLKGMDAIDQKRVRVDDTPELGITAQVSNALGSDDDAEAVFDDPEVIGATVKLAKGVYGYELLNGGNIDTAIKKAVGTIENYNGKKIVVPSGMGGWFEDDIEDAVRARAQQIGKSKDRFYVGTSAYSASQFAQELPSLKLQTYERLPGGGVAYLVLRNGLPVMNARSGEPFILEIGQ